MKVDVVMPTKNSVRPSLSETIDSIERTIPVNRLIAVDGGSTDGTLEYLGGRGATIIDDTNGTRATARNKGMSLTETEFFVCVDSDIILPPGWFDSILPYLGSPHIAGVMSYPIEKGTAGDIQRGLELLHGRTELVRRKQFGVEASVLRTVATKGISVPSDLQAGEDAFIGRELRSRGYDVLVTASPPCYHQRLEDESERDRFQDGQVVRRYGWTSLPWVLWEVVVAVVESGFIIASTQNVHAGCVRLKGKVLKLGGFLRG